MILDVVVDVDFQDGGVALHVTDYDEIIGRPDAEVISVTCIVRVGLLAALSVIVRVVARVGKGHKVTDALTFSSTIWGSKDRDVGRTFHYIFILITLKNIQEIKKKSVMIVFSLSTQHCGVYLLGMPNE